MNMKTRSTFLAMALIGFGCCHCSKTLPPAPPLAGPEKFTVHGENILVEGTMKPGSKISGAHAKSAIAVSVGVLER